jgi:hypothetical protein
MLSSHLLLCRQATRRAGERRRLAALVWTAKTVVAPSAQSADDGLPAERNRTHCPCPRAAPNRLLDSDPVSVSPVKFGRFRTPLSISSSNDFVITACQVCVVCESCVKPHVHVPSPSPCQTLAASHRDRCAERFVLRNKKIHSSMTPHRHHHHHS